MEARIALHASDDHTRLALVRAFEGAPREWDVFLWSEGRDFDVLVGEDLDGRRAIAFDQSNPHACLSSVNERLAAGRLRVTVVTGARRGTGASTLALHLASAIASVGDVCLLDLDRDSSLRARLDIATEARDWGDVSDGVLAAALPYSAGFRVLLAPRDGVGDAAAVLTAASQRFAHVIADAPTGPWRGLALAAASSAVLIVPPSRQGVAHARATLARHRSVDWTCVINRMGAGGELTARSIERELDRPIAVELPCSPYLRDREDDHRLLTERWSRYYRRVTRLAQAAL